MLFFTYFRKDQNTLQLPVVPYDRFDQYEPAFGVMFEALKIAYSTDVTKGANILNAIVEFGKDICKTARENKRFEVSLPYDCSKNKKFLMKQHNLVQSKLFQQIFLIFLIQCSV